MPSQAELQGMLGRSLSRRDVLKGAVAGAAYLYGRSRQDVQAQAVDPLKNPDAKDGIGFADPAFYTTWARTDLPVVSDSSRTWMWGLYPNTSDMYEEYDEAPGGLRLVQYFDKSRMEITHPVEDPDPNNIWYVTNGLLVNELVSGQMQVGNNRFIDKGPANVNVAGDADDEFGPTYASMARFLDVPPLEEGQLIIQNIQRFGQLPDDERYGQYNVTAGPLVDATNHRVAAPIWSFLNSKGVVYENGEFVEGDLFVNPFYATGYPITEAYWSRIKVAGQYRDVLIQLFERRGITYDLSNPKAFQMEAGNVGQHYYRWRYGGT